MSEKRQIIARNEQNEVSPPHRIAGGVRFDGNLDGGVERGNPARAAKVARSGQANRSLNTTKQFFKAARSRKPTKLDVY